MIGIMVAMEKEWDSLFMDLGERTGLIGRRSAVSSTDNGAAYTGLISGIGKVNAAVAAYRLIMERRCDTILSFGCAGGMAHDVHVGDVIVGDEYMYHDVWCGSPNAVGQVQGCPETFKSAYESWSFLKEYRHGLIATGDTFVESDVVMTAISNSLYPAHCPIAIDMESAAIAQVCERHGVGFTSVRVISDNILLREKPYDGFWESKDKTLSMLFRRFLEEE